MDKPHYKADDADYASEDTIAIVINTKPDKDDALFGARMTLEHAADIFNAALDAIDKHELDYAFGDELLKEFKTMRSECQSIAYYAMAAQGDGNE